MNPTATTTSDPMVRWPAPLRPGDLIAVTAPSSGVAGAALRRLDLVLQHLREQGYRVMEGQCLRSDDKHVSAAATRRAAELSAFLTDSEVAAIFPPWGGELATEVLDLLDFEGLRHLRPKWFMGYSDLSTIQLPLALCAGWATAHGPNLMDLAPTQTDPLTRAVPAVLGCDFSAASGPAIQHASPRFQKKWIPFEVQVDAPGQFHGQSGHPGPFDWRVPRHDCLACGHPLRRCTGVRPPRGPAWRHRLPGERRDDPHRAGALPAVAAAPAVV